MYQNFDTVKVRFDQKYLENFNPACFEGDNYFHPLTGEVRSDRTILKKEFAKKEGLSTLGFNMFDIKNHNSEVVMEVSSKVLKSDKLINYYTVENITVNINDSGVVKLNPYWIEGAKVLKIDCTDNIPVKSVSESLRDLSLLSVKRNYFIKDNKRGLKNNGIEIIAKAQTNNERLIAYDKFEDLSRKTAINKELLQYVDIEKYKNILRVESNLRNFEDIRNKLGIAKMKKKLRGDIITPDWFHDAGGVNIPTTKQKSLELVGEQSTDISFLEVLQTQRKVNLESIEKMFNDEKIIKYKNDLEYLFSTETTLNEIIKEFGMRFILSYCNYDITSVSRLLDNKFAGKKTDRSKYIRKFNDVLLNMKSSESVGGNYESIQAIKDYLRAS